MEKPRLPAPGPDEVAPEVRGIFETYLRERGNIPNMFRTAAIISFVAPSRLAKAVWEASQ